jgi:hypothetical protein
LRNIATEGSWYKGNRLKVQGNEAVDWRCQTYFDVQSMFGNTPSGCGAQPRILLHQKGRIIIKSTAFGDCSENRELALHFSTKPHRKSGIGQLFLSHTIFVVDGNRLDARIICGCLPSIAW